MPDEPPSYTISTIRQRRRKRAPTIDGPDGIYTLMHPLLKDADREYFYSLSLGTKNHVVDVHLVSVGSLSANLVHPREVFKRAIIVSAASIVCVHNHPSGVPDPSREDVEFTRRLVRCGEILGIKVLDHIILANGSYMSLKAEGKL